MSEQKVVKKSGRPKGSGHGEQVILKIRRELTQAFGILERKKTPLHVLLARQLEEDAAKTLNCLGKYMPQQISFDVGGSEFSNALSEVALRMAQHTALQNKDNNTIVDITPTSEQVSRLSQTSDK